MNRIDLDGRERDAVGRVMPHRVNVLGLHRAIPGVLALFSEKVPPRLYGGGARGVADRTIIAVACPCGSRVDVKPGRPFHPCPGCARWYLELAGRVRCAVLPEDMAEAA